MTTSKDVRDRIVRTFRRDLIGPGPDDADLARERLSENPSRWYLTGFLAPADDPLDAKDALDDPWQQEEMEREVDVPEVAGAGGVAGDNAEPDAPNTKRRFLPSSIGLTVLLPADVTEIEARVSWGDYRTEPPLPESVLAEQFSEDDKRKKKERPEVDWVRIPREAPPVRLKLDGRRGRKVVPESAAEQYAGGGLELAYHMRDFEFMTPDGHKEHVRAVTVFLGLM